MRTPLKVNPLRNPGQSVSEQIRKRIDDLDVYLVLAVSSIVYALMEWYRHFMELPTAPILMSVVAFVVTVVVGIKIHKERKSINSHVLGLKGEMTVGQHLEAMRSDGALVIHDIPCEGFNIDHVVISKQGVFMIETKTMSKPDRGKTEIVCDGDTLKINGCPDKYGHIAQAVANARYLSELLEQRTGEPVATQPILAFPGWFTSNPAGFAEGKPWALNSQGIPNFVRKRPNKLSDSDVTRIHNSLSEYVRELAL